MNFKNVMAMILAFLLSGLANVSMAQDEALPVIKEHKQSGIKYISGGVSDAERKAIAKIAQKYPVQLLFSVEGKTEPVTGVKVTVINVMGKKQLEAESEGPLFYFTPDSGRWTMDAEYDGEHISMTKDLVGRRYLVLEYKFKAQH